MLLRLMVIKLIMFYLLLLRITQSEFSRGKMFTKKKKSVPVFWDGEYLGKLDYLIRMQVTF